MILCHPHEQTDVTILPGQSIEQVLQLYQQVLHSRPEIEGLPWTQLPVCLQLDKQPHCYFVHYLTDEEALRLALEDLLNHTHPLRACLIASSSNFTNRIKKACSGWPAKMKQKDKYRALVIADYMEKVRTSAVATVPPASRRKPCPPQGPDIADVKLADGATVEKPTTSPSQAAVGLPSDCIDQAVSGSTLVKKEIIDNAASTSSQSFSLPAHDPAAFDGNASSKSRSEALTKTFTQAEPNAPASSSSSIASSPGGVVRSLPIRVEPVTIKASPLPITASPSPLATHIALAQYGDDSEDEGSLWNGSEGVEEGDEVVQSWTAIAESKEPNTIMATDELIGEKIESRKRRLSDPDSEEKEHKRKHLRTESLEEMLGISYDRCAFSTAPAEAELNRANSQFDYFGGSTCTSLVQQET